MIINIRFLKNGIINFDLKRLLFPFSRNLQKEIKLIIKISKNYQNIYENRYNEYFRKNTWIVILQKSMKEQSKMSSWELLQRLGKSFQGRKVYL